VIRKLCIAAVALGAIVLTAPTASADESLRVKEGLCVVHRDLALAYCATDPFPYLHSLIDGLPAR
jgi:hypothetical protein